MAKRLYIHLHIDACKQINSKEIADRHTNKEVKRDRKKEREKRRQRKDASESEDLLRPRAYKCDP